MSNQMAKAGNGLQSCQVPGIGSWLFITSLNSHTDLRRKVSSSFYKQCDIFYRIFYNEFILQVHQEGTLHNMSGYIGFLLLTSSVSKVHNSELLS